MTEETTQETLTVADGVVVSLNYTLKLDDGEVVDSSEGREPLEFLPGQGQIIPGLEKELYGMAIGDKKDVEVAPHEAYGTRDPEAMQVVPRETFPAGVDVQPGMGFRFRDQSGQPIMVFVADVRPDEVLLDLNHPLAGETLTFNVEIADLRPATEQEMAAACGSGSGCGGCPSQGACS